MISEKWNDAWLFWEDKDAFALVWDVPEKAVPITLPHDAMLLRDADPSSPGGGDAAYRFGGSYVYYKRFLAPAEWADRSVLLKFEGVYQEAAVYVNSQLAGRCPYGYSEFYVNLNDYLRPGEENAVRILVRTGDMPNCRWYSGAGVYRDVYLMVGGLTHIARGGVRVSTLALTDADALIAVDVPAVNRDHRPVSCEITTEIVDDGGNTAAVERTPVFLPAGGEETLRQRILVPDARLWSGESPALYTVRTTLSAGGVTLDSVSDSFGIRTLSLDAKHGLRVNGQTVKLRGACIHHDSGVLGAATYEAAEFRRVRLLKEAGFNAVRCAHNPAAPALLRACDALGVYVMDEAFDMWTRAKTDHDYSRHFGDDWRRALSAMADKDYNHPSVILYSLGNEIPEIATDHGAALGRAMASYMRDRDGTRFVMPSVNGVFASGDDIGRIMADVLSAAGDASGNVNNFMQAMDAHMDDIVTHPIVSRNLEKAGAGWDLIGYNYMTARYESDRAEYPHRVIVGSETYPPEIARNWRTIQRCPNVIGDFTWTGWDYLGEAGVGIPAYAFGEGGFGAQFPCQLAYTGDIDVTGFRRPASYYREIVFGLRKMPYIAVQDPARYGQQLIKTPWVLSDSVSSWTWRGYEGKPVVAEVYAPGDEAELLLNGASLGRLPLRDHLARFELRYEPGVLEAVSYEKGAALGRFALSTADKATRGLHIDQEEGAALLYAPITLRDGAGVVFADERLTLTCELEGDARLLGFGSGDPKPGYNYTGRVTDTWNGRALAVLMPEKEHGQAVLRVAGGDLTAEETLRW